MTQSAQLFKVKTLVLQGLFVSATTLGLSGCQTSPSVAPAQPATASALPAPVPFIRAASVEASEPVGSQTLVERTFTEGLELYEKGDYPAAIRKLQSPEMAAAWPELRSRVLKYLAFSYCVSGDSNACHKAFYDAMQIDPKFDLQPAEQGHPMWGPVFKKAKAGPPPTSTPRPARAAARPRVPAKPMGAASGAQ